MHWESSKNHLLSLECDRIPTETAAELVCASPYTYFYAQKRGRNDCLLYRWIAVCPICGISQTVKTMPELGQDQEETIRDFALWALQISMLGIIPNVPFVIGKWKVPINPSRYRCPGCGHEGYLSERTEIYELDKDDDCIVLQYRARGRRYRLPRRGVSPKHLYMSCGDEDVLADTITFDIATGLVTETVIENGTRSEYDITVSGPHGWLKELYCGHHELQTALRQVIGEILDCDDSEDATSHSLTEVIRRFRFRGYPENFIRSFPDIEEADDRIRFHNSMVGLPIHYSDIAEVFPSFGLPCKKQLQKIMYANPTLIMYLDEIKRLPFRNYDVTLKILSSPKGLLLLSLIFQFPKINDLIEAYIQVKGESRAWSSISCGIHYLAYTSAMWEYKRPHAITAGLLQGDIGDLYRRLSSKFESSIFFSIDYSVKEKNMQAACSGFRFVLPPSTRIVHEAAERLDNCLECYTDAIISHESTVYLVMYRGNFVAAIEVDIANMCVKQAYGAHNAPITKQHDRPLYLALSKWMTANGLRARTSGEGEFEYR